MDDDKILIRLDGSVVSPQYVAALLEEARREADQMMAEELAHSAPRDLPVAPGSA